MHSVHQLYQYRKSLSTTTYKARGQRVNRCEHCRLASRFCICELSPLAKITEEKKKQDAVNKGAGFLLLMYDTEVLKPSNTGKLIADIVPDTYAFLWDRTKENTELLAILNDDTWQPMVVFPEAYVEEGREVVSKEVKCEHGKRPLFIMLDGSWREAKKMFRKSPYLNRFPVISFDPELASQSKQLSVTPVGEDSRYTVRKTELAHQFSTAEVAARVLDMCGEHQNAHLLDLWFDVFNFQYQKSVCQRSKGNPASLENYQQYLQTLFT